MKKSNSGFTVVEILLALIVSVILFAAVIQNHLSQVKLVERQKILVFQSQAIGVLNEILSDQKVCTCVLSTSLGGTPMPTETDSQLSIDKIDLSTCATDSSFSISSNVVDPQSKVDSILITNFEEDAGSFLLGEMIIVVNDAGRKTAGNLSLPIRLEYTSGIFSNCQSLKHMEDPNRNRFLEGKSSYNSSLDSSLKWWDESRACNVTASVFSQASAIAHTGLDEAPKYMESPYDDDVINITSYDSVLSSDNLHMPPAIFGSVPVELQDYYGASGTSGTTLANFPAQNPVSTSSSGGSTAPVMSIPITTNLAQVVSRNNNVIDPASNPVPVISDLRSHWFIGSRVAEGSNLPVVVMPNGNQWELLNAFCFKGVFRYQRRIWSK